ncbi:MAG: peptidoglycan DD-metalloendopeptidase family protein [Clostridiales bacterium]|nr:peptidoglycan DD-metalloendopeptidase family protein [Clostridiales bacterium]
MKSNRSRGKLREAFTKEKIVRFLDKQGFYIVLFVCIAIIGITAYMTSEKPEQPQQEIVENQQTTEESQKQKEVAQTDSKGTQQEIDKDKIDIKIKDSVEQPDKADETEKAEDEKAQETLASNTPKKEEDIKKEDTSKKQGQSTSKASSSKAAMVYPVQGNILKEHTMDELVYSKTLKEWRTHPGLDIEASTGTEVKAALGGTVEEITEDPLMGICITLDHGNGLKTFYANLSTGNMVTVGQKVDKGQIISGVGSTASAEILDGPHLHFEVLLNGQSVDPKQYLK